MEVNPLIFPAEAGFGFTVIESDVAVPNPQLTLLPFTVIFPETALIP
jgi:hypothetical protein